ncbi:hypothetical protein [Rhizobium lentis]|uniref:Uncharacterized protein n=1 Tax=Rhizobium lentis TaxID=1138194 RepID=A0A7W8XL68_9HYPH|nr:hypothetical protein [Rhizobium lentis]MBB4577616.1 hypothetical protein [Rhizobium lentis]MBB5554202.1 hypothetical protein [Rhizobium lentis]MBB5564805.1 hypothetical protein [Rhizobium lentis]MBB5571293.1 hypothetical protein [Rhizobium lentis]
MIEAPAEPVSMPSIFEAKLGSMRHRTRSVESDDRHGERGDMEANSAGA